MTIELKEETMSLAKRYPSLKGSDLIIIDQILEKVRIRYRHTDNHKKNIGLTTAMAKNEVATLLGLEQDIQTAMACTIDRVAQESQHRKRWTFPTDKRGFIIVKNECYLP